MSASGDIQLAIAALLTGFTVTVGNASATSFALAHNLGTETVKAGVMQAGRVLILGTDFTVTVTDANHVTITSLIGAPALNAWAVTITALSAVFPIIARVSKLLENDLAAAVANQGLAISVMPMMPLSVVEGVPFVFIDRGEIRVRIIEKVALNNFGADAYQIRDDVMTLLHYRPRDGSDTPALTLGAMLAYPLALANPPAQMMFENGVERVIDVIFNVVFEINPG